MPCINIGNMCGLMCNQNEKGNNVLDTSTAQPETNGAQIQVVL